METLSAEYFKLVDLISQYDGYLMMIKGWSITVGMAVIGYAFQQANRSVLILCMVSSVSFYLMDIKFKEYQSSYYPRMQAIENCVDVGLLKSAPEFKAFKFCEIFKIDSSWREAKESGSFFEYFLNAGVLFPHLIVLLLSIALFFRPSLLRIKNS